MGQYLTSVGFTILLISLASSLEALRIVPIKRIVKSPNIATAIITSNIQSLMTYNYENLYYSVQ